MQQYLAWLEGQTFCSLPAYCTWKRQKGMLLVRFLDAQTLFFLVGFFFFFFFFLDLRRPLFSPNPEPQCLACWKIQQDLRLLGGFSLGYFPHILQRRKKKGFLFVWVLFLCRKQTAVLATTPPWTPNRWEGFHFWHKDNGLLDNKASNGLRFVFWTDDEN